MKRPRQTPSMFAASDSDSDSAPLPSRRKPALPTSSAAQRPPSRFSSSSSTSKKNDPLDAYMSTLIDVPQKQQPDPHLTAGDTTHAHSEKQPSQPHQTRLSALQNALNHQLPHDNDFGDGYRLISVSAAPESDVADEDEERRPSNRSRLDSLENALPPVDYTTHPPPRMVALNFTPPCELDTDGDIIDAQLTRLRVTVRDGRSPIISSFDHVAPPIPPALLDALNARFPGPTVIQAVALPHLLSRNDVVAVAQTGSGKTLAYGIPLLAFAARQVGDSRCGKGPVALVVVPTRELAVQVAAVLDELGAAIGARVTPVVGGVSKFEQFRRVRDGGFAALVATPGRMIDMLRMRACRMARCGFVVLDEADRMLDLGFGPQVKTLLAQIRPDAQLALLSATIPRFVDRLATDFMKQPVRISVAGSADGKAISMVNENVSDIYMLFPTEGARREWLLVRIGELVRDGLVIVFCSTRGDAASLANAVRGAGTPAACIHGETDQTDRDGLLRMFRAGELPLLVTTDLSARGLDIDGVKVVVNYGAAKSWDWHVHRVGRTGRAAQCGTAYTLLCECASADGVFAAEACKALRSGGRALPEALAQLGRASRGGSEGCGARKRGGDGASSRKRGRGRRA